MVCFLVLLFFQNPTYEEGLKILEDKGNEAAIEYYKKGVQKTGKPSLLFGLAWAFWKEGELQRAEDTCKFLLSKSPSRLVQARAHYLLGHVIAERDTKVSINHLETALGIFVELERPLNIYHSYESLGYACFKEGSLKKADEYLKKAIDVFKAETLSVNLGYIYSVKSRIAFQKKDIKTALMYTVQSRRIYEKANDNRMYNELVSEAFFYLLLGRYSDGVALMERVDKDTLRLELTKTHVYNAVNWILVYRCNKEDFEHLRVYVSDFIEQSDELNLKELLDLVLTMECP